MGTNEYDSLPPFDLKMDIKPSLKCCFIKMFYFNRQWTQSRWRATVKLQYTIVNKYQTYTICYISCNNFSCLIIYATHNGYEHIISPTTPLIDIIMCSLLFLSFVKGKTQFGWITSRKEIS